jgi:Trk K+ transport system NAD-binding subunit
MGSIILRELMKENKDHILVLDYNPEIIAKLKEKKISCIYGDACGPDMLSHVNVENLKEIISTAPNLEDGLSLLEKIKKINKNIRVILTAQTNDDALELYSQGADYVMLPRFTAGEIVANIIKKDGATLENVRKSQIARIKEAWQFFGKL